MMLKPPASSPDTEGPMTTANGGPTSLKTRTNGPPRVQIPQLFPLFLSQSAVAKAEGLSLSCHQHVFITWNGFIFYLLNWIAFRKGWGSR